MTRTTSPENINTIERPKWKQTLQILGGTAVAFLSLHAIKDISTLIDLHTPDPYETETALIHDVSAQRTAGVNLVGDLVGISIIGMPLGFSLLAEHVRKQEQANQ